MEEPKKRPRNLGRIFKYIGSIGAGVVTATVGLISLLASLDNHFGLFGGILAPADTQAYGLYVFFGMMLLGTILVVVLFTDAGMFEWVRESYYDKPKYFRRMGIYILAVLVSLSAMIALVIKLLS